MNQLCALLLAAVALVSAAGCPALLATGIYVWEGGNMVPRRVRCAAKASAWSSCAGRPRRTNTATPAHRAASRQRVSELLVENVKDIDVVNPREVDNWVDESDWGDFRELAEAVQADMVVHIELDDFELYKGKTLYQGRADVTVSVYDMLDHSKLVWERHLGEVLYPINSGIPAQDKPVQQFEREFVEIVADRIAVNFYRHDPHGAFAMDAMANR